MKFDVITLFPEIFHSPLNESIIGKAIDKGLIKIDLHNIRDFTQDRHKVVDDAPYGGGDGMVMKPGPVIRAIEAVRKENTTVILLSPKGKRFDQKEAKRLSEKEHLLLICGRYEGIDERVSDYIDETLSIGDFIMTGGEIAALAIVDSVARLLPEVLGGKDSAKEESFSWDILEYPHYTRPAVYREKSVPDVLLSGNHEEIRKWRRKEALRETIKMRPDLLEKKELTSEDMKFLGEIRDEEKGSDRN